MSVTVTFYKISDDARVLHKTLGDPVVSSVSATIKDNCDILNPTLVLRYNATIADANYMYIGAPFNRYYFMHPPVVSPGKRMAVSGTVDPLMSSQSEIESLTAMIVRNQNLQTKEIADSRAVATADTTTCSAKFDGTTFNTDDLNPDNSSQYHYVLTVIGGLANEPSP